MSSLSAAQRLTLHLVHTRRMTYRQAAAELGTTDEESARRLRQGLQQLRKSTADEEEHHDR
ncbi:hypothetical protein [Streptomyces boninensis]|uniref:hypothetical protein n=1 Tax=Streptomyces boninensis TaxID=2039455 RepID=UPI003B21BCD4